MVDVERTPLRRALDLAAEQDDRVRVLVQRVDAGDEQALHELISLAFAESNMPRAHAGLCAQAFATWPGMAAARLAAGLRLLDRAFGLVLGNTDADAALDALDVLDGNASADHHDGPRIAKALRLLGQRSKWRAFRLDEPRSHACNVFRTWFASLDPAFSAATDRDVAAALGNEGTAPRRLAALCLTVGAFGSARHSAPNEAQISTEAERLAKRAKRRA